MADQTLNWLENFLHGRYMYSWKTIEGVKISASSMDRKACLKSYRCYLLFLAGQKSVIRKSRLEIISD